jgi:hypothetical protein
VAEGGKHSSANRKMLVIIGAVDAPGVSCDPGEVSEPTKISLTMVDDDGDILIDNGKTVVCKGGVDNDGLPIEFNVKRSVFFESPLNCKDSAVPAGNSTTGLITSTATGSPGTAPYVTDTKIKCFR